MYRLRKIKKSSKKQYIQLKTNLVVNNCINIVVVSFSFNNNKIISITFFFFT